MKIDAEESPAVAERYDVDGFPTLILFERGKEVDRIRGAPRGDRLQALTSWIEERLAGLR